MQYTDLVSDRRWQGLSFISYYHLSNVQLMVCCSHLELTSVISTVLANISCSARTDSDCSRMKVQMARSGGTLYRAAAEGKMITGPHASVKGRQSCHKVSSCLRVGRGFQEAEAVPEALAGQT